ncbi:MAG: RDD family protein [Acidobacteria bacterium]|nr:RDD family protein [Acidobacteriota bacterium]
MPIDEMARFGDALICSNCKDSYAQRLREGVAPAAAGRYQYAGFWIRVLAVIIDSIILGVVQSILQFTALRPMLGTADLEGNPAALFAAFGAIGLLGLVSLAISCAYESIFVAQMGATPGKMALGMRVVRPDGSRVDLGRAVGRYFAKMLSGIILCIGYIMVGFDAEKRGLHDMICDTRVVRQTN